MRLVLDSNEYLFAYGRQRKPACQALLGHIVSNPRRYVLRVSRTILEEVRRNVASRGFKEFWVLLRALGVSIDEDSEVPFEIGAKYQSLGLKPGDAFIAAYTEWTGAEHLVTENRDFLGLARPPFMVVRAEEFLRKYPQGRGLS